MQKSGSFWDCGYLCGERWRIVGECGNMVVWDFGDGFGGGFLFALIFQWIAGLVWLQGFEKIFL